ncbi:MAG: hypothetical protein ACYDBH_09155 [Acidobacteriaceae bacterium]
MKFSDVVFGPGLRMSTLQDAAVPPEARESARAIPTVLRAAIRRLRPAPDAAASIPPDERIRRIRLMQTYMMTHGLLAGFGVIVILGAITTGETLLPGLLVAVTGAVTAGTAFYQRQRLLGRT